MHKGSPKAAESGAPTEAAVDREAAATAAAPSVDRTSQSDAPPDGPDLESKIQARFDHRIPELKRRVFGDARWTVSAAILVALDAGFLAAISRPDEVAFDSWLIVLALIVSLAIGSYRQAFSIEIWQSGRYAVLAAATVLPLVQEGETWQFVVLYSVAVVAILVISRSIGVLIVRVLRRRWPAPILVVGAGHMSELVVRVTREHPEYGLEAVGIVADVPVADVGLPRHALDDIGIVMQEKKIPGMIVTYGPEPMERVLSVISDVHYTNRRAWIIPRFFELSPTSDHIFGIPVARIPGPPLWNPARRAAKRVLGAIIASLALIVLSPILIGIAIAIKLDSRGSIFYRQPRMGEDGREFAMLKFRTMRVGSDAVADWTVKDDPRRTRVGTVLRKRSLDELPQLINVVRGDMSLVGPRPEQSRHAQHFSMEFPGYEGRTRVPGGLTGLSQVYDLRGDSSIEDRVRMDNRYVYRHSLLLDLSLMLRTVVSFFRSKTAG